MIAESAATRTRERKSNSTARSLPLVWIGRACGLPTRVVREPLSRACLGDAEVDASIEFRATGQRRR